MLRIQLPVPEDGLVLPAREADTLAVAVEQIEYLFTPVPFGDEESVRFIGKLVTKTGRPRLGGGVFHEGAPTPAVRSEFLSVGRALAVEFGAATLRSLDR